MTIRGPQNVPPYLYSFELGKALASMTNIEAQSAIQEPPSPHEFHLGVERYTTGSGNEYYDGYPVCSWHFTFMPVASWTWIMDFFTAGIESADVYVRTKDEEDSYQYFSAKMHRPEIGSEAQRGIQGYYDVTLRFTQMVKVTP